MKGWVHEKSASSLPSSGLRTHEWRGNLGLAWWPLGRSILLVSLRPKTQFRLKLCRQCGSVALIKSLSISELHLVATCRLLFLYLAM